MSNDAVKRLALRALNRMDGQPMPQDVLRDTLHMGFPNLPVGDLDDAVRSLESTGYIIGTHVEFAGIQWVLTAKGRLTAIQLS